MKRLAYYYIIFIAILFTLTMLLCPLFLGLFIHPLFFILYIATIPVSSIPAIIYLMIKE